MDDMQGVVEDFLTAGQSLFIIPECLIKHDDGAPVTGDRLRRTSHACDGRATEAVGVEAVQRLGGDDIHSALLARRAAVVDALPEQLEES